VHADLEQVLLRGSSDGRVFEPSLELQDAPVELLGVRGDGDQSALDPR